METIINQILSSNKDKSFVKRILNPESYPILKNKDNSHSTHSMAWAEIDGKYRVFPTVLYDGKKLTRFEPKQAWEKVAKTGNFINFDTPEEAAFFSQEYKTYWDK